LIKEGVDENGEKLTVVERRRIQNKINTQKARLEDKREKEHLNRMK